MSYLIRLAKENFKFSCSHFTILGPGMAERLHGHNYYVGVELEITGLDPALGMAFDFNLVKPMIRETTAALDELVLLPGRSPYLKIETVAGDSLRILFSQKRYELPSEDVRILTDAVNVTSEELAKLIANELLTKLRERPEALARLSALSVAVEETRGQSVIYRQEVRA